MVCVRCMKIVSISIISISVMVLYIGEIIVSSMCWLVLW